MPTSSRIDLTLAKGGPSSDEHCAIDASTYGTIFPGAPHPSTTTSGSRPQIRVAFRGHELTHSALYTVREVLVGTSTIRLGDGGSRWQPFIDDPPSGVNTSIVTVDAMIETPGALTSAPTSGDPTKGEGIVILAPHGGWIERYSDEVAKLVKDCLENADRNVSTWTCAGNKAGSPVGAYKRWHIRSTDISEHSFVDLASLVAHPVSARQSIAFHGYRPKTKADPHVLIGGDTRCGPLKELLRKRIGAALAGSGLDSGHPIVALALPGDPYGGDDADNIVNRVATDQRIQFELSKDVREAAPRQKLAAAICSVADPFIRDVVDDIGQAHDQGMSCKSPDVIVSQTQFVDPGAEFGETSGTLGKDDLGETVELGAINYVYVRVHNAGFATARDVTVTVYWAPYATITQPPWHLIGTARVTVEPGEVTVTPAIVWNTAVGPDLKIGGSQCFIATVETNDDPTEIPTTITDFSEFVRSTNNVAWHNFQVIDLRETQFEGLPDGWWGVSFLVPGAIEQEAAMTLEVEAELPDGADLACDIPIEMLEWTDSVLEYEVVDDTSARLVLDPISGGIVGQFVFPAASTETLRVLGRLPDHAWELSPSYDLAASQSLDGIRLGRVAWRLTDGPERPRT